MSALEMLLAATLAASAPPPPCCAWSPSLGGGGDAEHRRLVSSPTGGGEPSEGRWRGQRLAEAEGIPSLTGRPGDPARGRAIVADRTRGLCLLCHSAPIPEERFQGDLAPSLAGAASRNSEAELRLRVVDSRRINPDSIMPAYGRTDGLERVGAAWRGRTILSPADIEDVVSYLSTLKEDAR